MRLVLDASTAILLARVGLLRRVAARQETWIGEAAAAEALAKQTDDAIAIATLIQEGTIQRRRAEHSPRSLMREFRLDVGEAESILMAKGLDAVCATDDGPAIRCCKVLGVPFVTAIGFLVALAEAGELGDGLASELPAELERHGRYHPRILEDAALRIAAATRRGGRS